MNIAPAIITTKEAHAYVGGVKIWHELLALYHKAQLKPFRTLPRGDQQWSVSTLDGIVRVAEMDGVLNDRSKVHAAMRQAMEDGVIPRSVIK